MGSGLKYRIAAEIFRQGRWRCRAEEGRLVWAGIRLHRASRSSRVREGRSNSPDGTCAAWERRSSTSMLLSRLDQKALTTYAQPHFMGTQWQSVGSFSLERTSENPLFTAALGDVSFQVERLIHRQTNTRLQLRYDFNKTVLSHLLVPDLVLEQDRNVLLSTFSATLIHDTRDNPLDAHRGLYSTTSFGITPTALGSSANFTKLFGQLAYYRPVHSLVFANSIRSGAGGAVRGKFCADEPVILLRRWNVAARFSH